MGEIRVPNRSKFNEAERKEASEAEKSVNAFSTRLMAVCQAAEAARETVSKEWLMQAERAARTNNVKNEDITYGMLQALLLKEESAAEGTAHLTFFELFDRYYEQHQGTKRRKDHVLVVERALRRFELYSGVTLDVDAFSADHLRMFRDFMRDEYKICKRAQYKHIYKEVECRTPVPRGTNYILNVLKVVRAFFTWATMNGYTDNDPFRRFSLAKEVGSARFGTPYYLTLEERDRLYEYSFDTEALNVQRDVFVFQCCVGCRVSDLYRLTRANIITDEDGSRYLSYIPRKTKEESDNVCEVPLNEIACEILDRYADYDGNGLFPFVSEIYYNSVIKKLLRLAGVDRVVTTLNSLTRLEEQHELWEVASSHMARRTFVGNLYKICPDPNIIGSMSGHTDGSRAFARYRKIERGTKVKLIKQAEKKEAKA